MDSSFNEDMSNVARLSIVQVALLAQEVSNDTACGFESDAVKAAVQVEGEVGQMGRAVYRVDACTLGYDSIETVIAGCNRDPVTLTGRAHITASLVIEGIVTGRADPIIPAGPDAIAIILHSVVLDGFSAQFASNNASLVMREGSLSAEVRPRLARADNTGFCSVATGDTEVRNLAYDGASLMAREGEAEALVFVSSSRLSGQLGMGLAGENTFGGTMSVGGQTLDVPGKNGSSTLDDDYDRAEFEAGFGCSENLARPVDYACACEGNLCHPDAPVADGVARLLPFVFGNIVALIEDDARCGFASSSLAPAIYNGALGEHGTATEVVETGCRLSFAFPHRRSTNCHGVTTLIEGTATVAGTRSVRGTLTGDVDGVSAIPTSMDGLDYALTIELDNFHVWTSSDAPSLLIESGTLTGTMRPTLALDPEEKACVTATPHAAIEVVLQDAQVQVVDGEDSYPLAVTTSRINAVAGSVGAQVNVLDGTVNTVNEEFLVPSDASGLDPDYDAAHFDAGFLCEPNVSWPTVPADCSLARRLAPDVARAAAVVLATATRRVVTDEVCGVAAVTTPVAASAELGTEGTVTSSVTACALTEDGTEVVGDNCYRTQTFAEGSVELSGTRVATGIVAREPGRLTVTPIDRLPYRDRFTAEFRGYRVWSLARDSDTPSLDVQFQTGGGSIDMIPVMGESEESPGIFDVPTPVTRMPSLQLHDIDALLAGEGRHFAVRIDEAMLQINAGLHQGHGNTVSGYVVLDGERVEIGPGTPFDAGYDQAAFDGTYTCTPDLRETVPPN